MGLIGAQIEAALPNATKCASWQDIQASHVSMDHVPLTIKAFFGGLSLLAFGLGSSLLGFCTEKLVYKYRKHNEKAKQNGLSEEHYVVKSTRGRQVRPNQLVGNLPNKMENPCNGPAEELPAPSPDMAIYQTQF